MRYLSRAVLPGALIAGGVLAGVKLIATGSARGLLHGGWMTALNVVGWTIIVALALGVRAYERRQKIEAMALQMIAKEALEAQDAVSVPGDT